MRQVRLDELTYALFAGMRRWRAQDRKALAGDAWDRFDEWRLEHAAKELIQQLHGCEFYGGSEPEPLGPKALETLLVDCMKRWPGERRQQFVAPTPREREWAKYHAAHLLADQLGAFTILRDAPEPPFFRFANFEGGSGAVPETDEEWDRRRRER